MRDVDAQYESDLICVFVGKRTSDKRHRHRHRRCRCRRRPSRRYR